MVSNLPIRIMPKRFFAMVNFGAIKSMLTPESPLYFLRGDRVDNLFCKVFCAMPRLFVGLALPGSIRRLFSHMSHGLPDVRWVDHKNYHINLRFIGEVDHHAVADIDDTLRRIESRTFDLTIGGLGTFGQRHKMRALWARVHTIPDLMHLQSKIESAVVRAGQSPESRKFVPHITLARFRTTHPDRILSYIQYAGLFQAGPVVIDRFVLFDSYLGKGGSHYEELAEYPLMPAEQLVPLTTSF